MMVNAIKKRKKMMEDDTENDSWRVLTRGFKKTEEVSFELRIEFYSWSCAIC